MSIIALLTDFGTRDWFVGSMKGVILGINPAVSVVDITHAVSQGNIRASALALMASYRCFPKKTIFTVVVDPGVGSSRRAIVADTGFYCFVAPDNGVLSFVLREQNKPVVYAIENDTYFRKSVSTTFHGRDIFAPVAAYLSTGISPVTVGPEVKKWITISWPELLIAENDVTGVVIYIDHFGNAFTNITSESIKHLLKPTCYIPGEPTKELPIVHFYEEVPDGEACALINSAGYLEIAVNNGNAAEQYALAIESTVRIHCR